MTDALTFTDGRWGRKINQAVKLLSYLFLGQGFDREITTDS